jgi:hypothetical protein
MAMFGSPVGLFILLVLYGANLYAAYEVAVYRGQPTSTVCGLAAIPFLGVLSPIVFIAMPNKVARLDWVPEEQSRFQAIAPPTDVGPSPAENVPVALAPAPPARPATAYKTTYTTAASPGPEPAAAALPEPIVFRRGDFSFNRRFFETKLAGFFRLVPSEADKDMVVFIKSGRGEFAGRRIIKITPNELYLQVFHDNATADEMIPFVEILEVQIRHKDLV